MFPKALSIIIMACIMTFSGTCNIIGADNVSINNQTSMTYYNQNTDISKLRDVTPQPTGFWEKTWHRIFDSFLGLFYPGCYPTLPKGM